jgi:hypothetical protein
VKQAVQKEVDGIFSLKAMPANQMSLMDSGFKKNSSAKKINKHFLLFLCILLILQAICIAAGLMQSLWTC